jgi:hypothetical protein
MRQLRALLAASFLIGCFQTATLKAQLPGEQSLQPGTPIERTVGPGQVQTFTITLEEKQFVQLVVNQRGIDVVVRVVAPEGKSLGEFDSPNGDNGPENVSFAAATAGVYRVSVTLLNPEANTPNGKFEIRIVEVRQASEQELNTAKNLETVKAKGLDLLADIESLIADIHSPITRAGTQLQLAQMLWTTDEKRASKFLNDAMMGVKELLANLDPNTDEYAASYSPIASLRWEIIRVLAQHDPDSALSFLHSTKAPPNPYGNERELAEQERTMELTIVNQIIANDPKRAFQIARQSLKSGYSSDIMNTVAMLRQKNPELATQLATEVANKLLNEKLLKSQQAASLAVNLVSVCNAKPSRNQGPLRGAVQVDPLLPEQTCRDLLQKALQEALSFQLPPRNNYTPERDAAWSMLSSLRSLGPDLDANAEGGAAAVEKKLAEITSAANPFQQTMESLQAKIESGGSDTALESIQKAPEEIRNALYNQLANSLAAKGDIGRARQVLENLKNPYERRHALQNLEQQEMYRAVGSGKVEEALRAITLLKTPRERASMLMQLIRQIGPGQKRANAVNYLEQVRSLLAPGVQAQDQEQMGVLLELARAFSRYDMKRAFEILDPLVEQVNDICGAARTLDGFGNDFYRDDELDLQNGNNVANIVIQLSNALGSLAVTNFDRAKATTDRLRLPEVRLRVYLDIAQQTIQGSRP